MMIKDFVRHIIWAYSQIWLNLDTNFYTFFFTSSMMGRHDHEFGYKQNFLKTQH